MKQPILMQNHEPSTLAYLAAIIDGEGCIAFARRTDYNKHRLEVRYDVKLAMTCRDTMESVRENIADIVGDDSVNEVYEERRRARRRRPLYRFEVSSKRGVHTLLTTLEPYMRTKRVEAQLVLRYLDRALPHARYRADDYDRRLAEVATALRNGCGEARAEAKVLLGQVIPSQAVPGQHFGVEGTEGVETRSVSPNNTPTHERPAPTLRSVG